MSSINGGLTPAAMAARCAGSHAYFWGQLNAWCGNASNLNRTNSELATSAGEYVMAYALAGAVGNNSTFRNKAISAALYVAGLTGQSEARIREHLKMMGFTYDWCYSYLTAGNRTTLRAKIASYAASWKIPVSNEWMHGHSQGNMCYAATALAAILGDGSAGENTTWEGYMDDCLDSWFPGSGSPNTGLARSLRYFGDTDGGTYKGGGAASYSSQNQEWQVNFFAVCWSALQLALHDPSRDPWWALQGYWKLFHWRQDRRLAHWGGECHIQERYDLSDHIYLAARNSELFGLTYGGWYDYALAWLYREMRIVGKNAIWGPYHLYNCLYYNPSIMDAAPASTPPTIERLGWMRVFRNARTVAFTTGWNEGDPGDTSMVVRCEPFIGGHSDPGQAGSFSMARRGPLVTRHGFYDGNQGTTYKIDGDALVTGHRYSYKARDIAFACCTIYDSDEPSENLLHSLQRSISAESFFGRHTTSHVLSNIGGKLWPKGVSETKYQPDHFAQWQGEALWNFETFPAEPVAADNFGYVVMNLLPWFYSSKCTRYKRHIVWIKPNKIVRELHPDPETTVYDPWPDPIVLIWDDMTTHLDATAQRKTQAYLLPTLGPLVPGSGGWNHYYYSRTLSRFSMKMLRPTCTIETRNGFQDLTGVVYPETFTPPSNAELPEAIDKASARTHYFHPAAATTAPGFFSVICPTDYFKVESALPAFELIEDATWIGVSFPEAGVTVRIKKGDSHEVQWVTEEDPIPSPPSPSPPPSPPPPEFSSTNNYLRSASCLLFPYFPILPFPYGAQGTLSQGDRRQILGLYSGLEAEEEDPGTPGDTAAPGHALGCDSTPVAGAALGCSSTPVVGHPIEDDIPEEIVEGAVPQ